MNRRDIEAALADWQTKVINSRQSTRVIERRSASRSGDEPARKVRPRSEPQ